MADLISKPNDGFDVLEYPLDFTFKALVRVNLVEGNAEQMVRDLVCQAVAPDALLSSSVKGSKTGKFESISVSVRLESRAQLEAIYAGLAAAPQVVMTL